MTERNMDVQVAHVCAGLIIAHHDSITRSSSRYILIVASPYDLARRRGARVRHRFIGQGYDPVSHRAHHSLEPTRSGNDLQVDWSE
jgi:hypothetical protein